jgi:O-antigen/teichoic acid export membrane protein
MAAEPGGPLGRVEVRARAATAAALLGARGALIYALGIVANLVLARLLVPRDFGLVALGTGVVILATFLADGGLGASLIRREEPPEPIELQAVNALQLALTVAVAVATLAAALPFGEDGLVVASMIASLPIAILRAPSVIVLERELHYRVVATADVVEALVYYAWAIGAVALGLGVWGLATAVVVRAAAGTGTVLALGPLGLVRPRWSWRHVRPLLAFGAKVQGSIVLLIAREQGVNVIIAAVGSVSTLGAWNLAWRVMQVPNLLFLAVGRVAFPALSRLLGAGEDARPVLERGIAVLGVVTGVVAVAMVGLAPALPEIVGSKWSDVPAVILWSGLALIVAAPVGVATPGYLFAVDEAGVVAAATVLSGVVWFGVIVALLPAYGAAAAGIGWLVGGLLGSAVLLRRTVARSGAALVSRAAGPAAVALAATAVGWFVAHLPDQALLGGALGALTGELVLVAGLMLTSRRAFRDTGSLAREGLSGLRRRGSRVGSGTT